jgi:hypothetical protein
MEIIDAIDNVKKLIEYCDYKHYNEGDYPDWKKDVDSLTVALVCMEKQIPVSPIIKKWMPAECPTCGESLSKSLGDGYYKHNYGQEFCVCGQRIEWDD